MTLQDDGQELVGLAREVRVVDWESGIPMSRAVRRDPRMPRLGEVPGFTRWIAEGWGDADRSLTIEPGSAGAAAEHRRRLSEALPGRTLVVTAGRAQLRVGDTFFEFRADSDFLWLVGHGVEDGSRRTATCIRRVLDVHGHLAELFLDERVRVRAAQGLQIGFGHGLRIIIDGAVDVGNLDVLLGDKSLCLLLVQIGHLVVIP